MAETFTFLTCPKCGKKHPDSQRYCPDCGLDARRPWPSPTPPVSPPKSWTEPPPVPAAKVSPGVIGCFALFMVLAVAGALIHQVEGASPTDAKYMAQEFVKRDYVGAEDFSEVRAAKDTDLTTGERQHFVVVGVVSGKNPFGGPARQAFVCHLSTADKGDNWTCESLSLH